MRLNVKKKKWRICVVNMVMLILLLASMPMIPVQATTAEKCTSEMYVSQSSISCGDAMMEIEDILKMEEVTKFAGEKDVIVQWQNRREKDAFQRSVSGGDVALEIEEGVKRGELLESISGGDMTLESENRTKTGEHRVTSSTVTTICVVETDKIAEAISTCENAKDDEISTVGKATDGVYRENTINVEIQEEKEKEGNSELNSAISSIDVTEEKDDSVDNTSEWRDIEADVVLEIDGKLSILIKVAVMGILYVQSI